MSERKLFKFYKSYMDVMNELPEKNQLEFIKAILNKQFYGVEPNLKGIVKLAYVSQKHSIDRQVKGFEDKTGITILDPIKGGVIGGVIDPTPQIEIEVEIKEENRIYKSFDKLSILNSEFDNLLKLGYSKTQIDNTLESIENYAGNKKYKSLYLTAKNWLSKEPKQQMQETKEPELKNFWDYQTYEKECIRLGFTPKAQ